MPLFRIEKCFYCHDNIEISLSERRADYYVCAECTDRLKHGQIPCDPATTEDVTSKSTNPKDTIGSDKLPLHLWPEVASVHGALALLDGALKYGRANWRHDGARASIYYDACRRHLDKWFEGTTTDPDSGLHHLAHALASLAIILDAEQQGVLVDDRQFSESAENFEQFVVEQTPHVKRMKAKYANRDPKHWTIRDMQLDKEK